MSERVLQIQKAAVSHVAAVWAQGSVFKLTSQHVVEGVDAFEFVFLSLNTYHTLLSEDAELLTRQSCLLTLQTSTKLRVELIVDQNSFYSNKIPKLNSNLVPSSFFSN